MEEAFKKMEDGDSRGGGCSTSTTVGVGEGAEEIIDGVMKETREGGEFLDCDHEDWSSVGLPSLEANVDKPLEVLDCVEILDDAAQEIVGSGDVNEVQGDLKSGKESGDSQRTTKKVVLDWKKAVVGGVEGKKGSAERELALLRGGVVNAASPSCGNAGKEGGSGVKTPHTSTAKESAANARPAKHCRELKFDEELGSFLGADGVTVQVDRVAVTECEKDLECALVGKILGRQVPFGFLSRELKKKWGKFGRAHLSMVGKNSFVCFFSSKDVRDKVLRGGPWFVGNQLVGVARWSSAFDPSSINGFSTPIWVRFPHLPLNLWSDQNLGRIASMIGQPLWVDEVTSSWGRTEFARVCVRINFDKKLPKGVWVQGVEKRFFQIVEYEGIDHICFHCGGVGHINGDCLKRSSGLEKGDGGEKPLDVSQVFGDEEVTVEPTSQVGGSVDGQKVVAPPTIFGHDFSQPMKDGVHKYGNDLVDSASQSRGKAGPIMGVKHNAGSSSVAASREDLEGGGWTLVARRKPGNQFKKQGAKPKGFPTPVRRQMGAFDGSKECKGEAPILKSGPKPALVYKRVARRSASFVSSGVTDGLVPSKEHLDEAIDSGRSASHVSRLKRPMEADAAAGRDCEEAVVGELREVDPGALVVFQPAFIVSSVEEVEGIKKRRKGGESSHCGGDASPLVV